LRRPRDGRVVGQPEVVVSAEVNDGLADHDDMRLLWRLEHPLPLVEALGRDRIKLRPQLGPHAGEHLSAPPTTARPCRIRPISPHRNPPRTPPPRTDA